VPLGEHARNSPLGIFGIRLVAVAFGHDDHLAVRRGLEREAKPSNAAPDDEVVANGGHRKASLPRQACRAGRPAAAEFPGREGLRARLLIDAACQRLYVHRSKYVILQEVTPS